MRKFLHHVVVILSLSTAVLVEGATAAVELATIALDSNRVVEQTPVAIKRNETQRTIFSAFRNFFPFRTNGNAESEKSLSNVKVFPNPVVDQINLSYRLGKKSAVSIKVMDALGNEVMTLLQQDLDAGPQSHSFETGSKLTNGIYFIKVAADAENVIKRISVL